MVAGLVVVVIIAARAIPHDTTDPEGGRSGLSLYIDELTGCQYIRVGFFTKLTPRLDENGAHLCKGDEQRWQDYYARQAKEQAERDAEEARYNALTLEERRAENKAKADARRELRELLAEKGRRREAKKEQERCARMPESLREYANCGDAND